MLEIISNAKNPAVGIGKAIIAVALPVAEAMAQKKPELDPAIWLSDDGVLDAIVDELMEVADAAGIEVTEDDADVAKESVYADLQRMLDSAQDGSDPMAAEGAQPQAAPTPLMSRARPSGQTQMGGMA